MIKAFLKDEKFLADVAEARGRTECFHLWWLGQSGFLIQWQGRHLLMDPYLSDSLTEKYAGTDKPHVRMSERVVDPARLNFIDVVTSSHNHSDHLDAATLKPILAANPRVVLLAPEANQEFVAQRLAIALERVTVIDDGAEVTVGPFHFTGIAAAHVTVDRDAQGRCQYLGYVVRMGPWTIYHSGDCVVYEGLARRLGPYNIDLALLPINGADPQRRVAGNMNAREAAGLARHMGARMAIPCHYDMFEFNTASPDEFGRRCELVGQPYQILQLGQRWSASQPKPKGAAAP